MVAFPYVELTEQKPAVDQPPVSTEPDLHGLARKDREMRMLLERPGGGLVRFRAHDHERAHLVAHVLNAALGDLLRLAERPSHG
jgi:hypothetical protein